jgi:hypothetical protein
MFLKRVFLPLQNAPLIEINYSKGCWLGISMMDAMAGGTPLKMWRLLFLVKPE